MDKKIQVLYAEDNLQDADMAQVHFQQEAPEFELEIVGTGKRCLERLKAKGYDALLLDYRLPDMDGTDVLKTLLLQGSTLPVIMVTGVGDEELVVKALRMGASDYVPKRGDYLIALPGILRNITHEYRRKKKAGHPLVPTLKRILYIEHTQMDIELTVRHFAETAPHIHVEPVRSGQEALQILTQKPDGRKSKPCDLVLADLRGSDMSALDLCREIKHRGINLPLIVITGRGDEEAAAAALQLGAYDYIVKSENYLTKLPYAVENAVARFHLDQTNRSLRESLEQLRRAVETTIQVMASAVEVRDPYTAGHQIRSADLSRAIAVEMGLPQEKIDAIRMAGCIHDIGKLSVPAEILSKPTKLSEIEFSLIKEHSRRGYEILKDVESPWPLAEMVYQHHERMDGSGYPRNLKGEEILMEARILAVADVVEAMASHRPYRPSLGIDAALDEIEKNRGIFYDKTVADACLSLFREKGYQLEGA